MRGESLTLRPEGIFLGYDTKRKAYSRDVPSPASKCMTKNSAVCEMLT